MKNCSLGRRNRFQRLIPKYNYINIDGFSSANSDICDIRDRPKNMPPGGDSRLAGNKRLFQKERKTPIGLKLRYYLSKSVCNDFAILIASKLPTSGSLLYYNITKPFGRSAILEKKFRRVKYFE